MLTIRECIRGFYSSVKIAFVVNPNASNNQTYHELSFRLEVLLMTTTRVTAAVQWIKEKVPGIESGMCPRDGDGSKYYVLLALI